MALFSDVLLTVDYDRTLTDPQSRIPGCNLEAIRYFMDHGGAFTVNTGRSLPMIHTFRDKVPVNAPLLLYNGSAAYDLEQERITFSHEIHLDLWDTVRRCRELFPEFTTEVQGLSAHYCFEEDPIWDSLCDNCQCPRKMAHPGDDLGPFLKFTIYGRINSDILASLFEATPEEKRRMDEAEAMLRRDFGDKVEVFRAAARIIDVHTKGVSKIRSARELQQQLGRRILVCVGDGENDVPMLDGADYAYCPSDAVVRERYENVCSCSEGAVADVIYNKIPGILGKPLDN